jgi:hypothetical protein
MTRWLKFLALGAKDRRLLVTSLILLWGTRLGLRWFGWATMSRILSQFARRFRIASSRDRVRWASHIAARAQPASKFCLAQALTEQTLLRCCGQDATLHIGVAKHEGRLQAHAWITADAASELFVPLL